MANCVQFDPVLVHRAKVEENDFVDKMRVVSRADAAKRNVESLALGGSWRPRARMISLSCARGGLHVSFAGGDRHQYFCETPDRALVEAVSAHAAQRGRTK